jgi:Raf kinase inhibitor-like YbhB/YbcL family protein
MSNINFIKKIDFTDKNNIIKRKYICLEHKGFGYNPHIKWFFSSINKNSIKSYALILEDPDAVVGNFVHWYVPYISKNINEIMSFKNKPTSFTINYSKIGYNIDYSKIKLLCGKNSINNYNYHGPCAPKDSGIHRYILTIYALDNIFKLSKDTESIKDSNQFEQFIKNNNINILGKSHVISKYFYQEYN